MQKGGSLDRRIWLDIRPPKLRKSEDELCRCANVKKHKKAAETAGLLIFLICFFTQNTSAVQALVSFVSKRARANAACMRAAQLILMALRAIEACRRIKIRSANVKAGKEGER
jgi:hypothetical protein